MNYPEQRNDAPPARIGPDEGEYWRRKGYELVMRYGTDIQKMEAQARLKEVLAIQRQTAKWMAEQHRKAA